jgi:hypothetical protein
MSLPFTFGPRDLRLFENAVRCYNWQANAQLARDSDLALFVLCRNYRWSPIVRIRYQPSRSTYSIASLTFIAQRLAPSHSTPIIPGSHLLQQVAINLENGSICGQKQALQQMDEDHIIPTIMPPSTWMLVPVM